MIYRNSDGYVLSGPEYLTVFNGQTGAEMATVDFAGARGTVSSWGDDYGNRVDRFLATAAYVDTTGLPSFIMARGYYTRTTLAAWNWRGGQLTQLWKFDSNTTPKDAAGPHLHRPGLAQHDGRQRRRRSRPGDDVRRDGGRQRRRGPLLDRLQPRRRRARRRLRSRRGPASRCSCATRTATHPAYHIRDARTCAIIQAGPINGADTGRCVADDISRVEPGRRDVGVERRRLISATTQRQPRRQAVVAELPDLVGRRRDARARGRHVDQQVRRQHAADRERLRVEQRHQVDAGADRRSATATGARRSSGARATARALRLYTTTDVTTRRIYTLMHDAQYRVQVSAEQTAYNQPPHPGFHIGSGMVAPPEPEHPGSLDRR